MTRAAQPCRKLQCYHFRPCPDHPEPGPWQGRAGARARGYTAAWDRASREMRKRGELCGYCHARLAVELDHRIPLSQGGSRDPKENGVPACKRCQDEKAAGERMAGRLRAMERP